MHVTPATAARGNSEQSRNRLLQSPIPNSFNCALLDRRWSGYPRHVCVKWDATDGEASYRVGAKGFYDLMYADEGKAAAEVKVETQVLICMAASFPNCLQSGFVTTADIGARVRLRGAF